MSDNGVDDSAILLMSLGHDEAAEVFKYLSPISMLIGLVGAALVLLILYPWDDGTPVIGTILNGCDLRIEDPSYVSHYNSYAGVARD